MMIAWYHMMQQEYILLLVHCIHQEDVLHRYHTWYCMIPYSTTAQVHRTHGPPGLEL